MVYRVFALLGALALLGLSLAQQHGEALLYFSQWIVILTVGTYSSLVLNYCTKAYWRYAHFLYELAWSSAFTDMVLYWSFIYPGTSTLDLVTLGYEHIGVCLLLVVDAANNQVEFYRRHLFLVLLFMLVYVSFALCYALADQPLYKGMSFSNGLMYAYIAVGFTSTILSFIVGSYIYKFKRRYVAEKLEDHDFTAMEDLAEDSVSHGN